MKLAFIILLLILHTFTLKAEEANTEVDKTKIWHMETLSKNRIYISINRPRTGKHGAFQTMAVVVNCNNGTTEVSSIIFMPSDTNTPLPYAFENINVFTINEKKVKIIQSIQPPFAIGIKTKKGKEYVINELQTRAKLRVREPFGINEYSAKDFTKAFTHAKKTCLAKKEEEDNAL